MSYWLDKAYALTGVGDTNSVYVLLQQAPENPNFSYGKLEIAALIRMCMKK